MSGTPSPRSSRSRKRELSSAEEEAELSSPTAAEYDDLAIDGTPISKMKVVELRAELEQRHLSKSGTKAVLLERLKQFLLTVSRKTTTTADDGAEENVPSQDPMESEQVIDKHSTTMKTEDSADAANVLERQTQHELPTDKGEKEGDSDGQLPPDDSQEQMISEKSADGDGGQRAEEGLEEQKMDENELLEKSADVTLEKSCAPDGISWTEIDQKPEETEPTAEKSEETNENGMEECRDKEDVELAQNQEAEIADEKDIKTNDNVARSEQQEGAEVSEKQEVETADEKAVKTNENQSEGQEKETVELTEKQEIEKRKELAEIVEVSVPKEMMTTDKCELCQVEFTDVIQSTQHYQGKKHAHKANQYVWKVYADMGIDPTRFFFHADQSAQLAREIGHKGEETHGVPTAETKDDPEKYRFMCTLCDLQFEDLDCVEKHVDTGSHKQNVIYQDAKETERRRQQEMAQWRPEDGGFGFGASPPHWGGPRGPPPPPAWRRGGPYFGPRMGPPRMGPPVFKRPRPEGPYYADNSDGGFGRAWGSPPRPRGMFGGPPRMPPMRPPPPPTQPKATGPQSWYCEACSCELNSQLQFEQHNASKKHLKKMEQLQTRTGIVALGPPANYDTDFYHQGPYGRGPFRMRAAPRPPPPPPPPPRARPPPYGHYNRAMVGRGSWQRPVSQTDSPLFPKMNRPGPRPPGQPRPLMAVPAGRYGGGPIDFASDDVDFSQSYKPTALQQSSRPPRPLVQPHWLQPYQQRQQQQKQQQMEEQQKQQQQQQMYRSQQKETPPTDQQPSQQSSAAAATAAAAWQAYYGYYSQYGYGYPYAAGGGGYPYANYYAAAAASAQAAQPQGQTTAGAAAPISAAAAAAQSAAAKTNTGAGTWR